MNIITMSCTNNAGGIDRNNEQLIGRLLEKGWDVQHISPDGFRYKNHKNLSYYPLKHFGNIFPAVSFFPQALYKLSRIKLKDKIIIAYNFDVGVIGAYIKSSEITTN